MPPTATNSIIGMRPTTCHGRSGSSQRDAAGADPAVHYAFYEFADVAEAEALIGSDKIKPLVADFDRVWGDRVSRRREVLEIVQEQAP
jgi:hypothetical protein